MQREIKPIAERIVGDITKQLNQSGIMYRLFYRVKSMRSIRHKLEIKGEKYFQGKAKIQDIIGLRIVVYFQDDVDALSMYFSCSNLVKRSVDELDTSTFCPQRLNLTRTIPEDMVEDFRAALPLKYAPMIDSTYEIQIRTIFSEGWHEVEHDMRYKCKEDWVGCEDYSRALNGLIATLETAEWNMKALFNEMAMRNMHQHNYRAMLRNKMRLRIKGENFSSSVANYLNRHESLAESILQVDRMIVVFMLLKHKEPLEITFDNLLFLLNRLEIRDEHLMSLETPEFRRVVNSFFNS